MTNTIKNIGLVIAGVVVGLLISAGSDGLFGGVYNQVTNYFRDGIKIGTSNQLIIDGDGDLTSTGETAVQGFTQGGGVGTLTDANGGTYTLTQAELLASNYLKFAAGGAGQEVIALAMPATSTMTTLIPNAGDCREWVYDSSALSAATTTTLTLGTGHDIIAYTTNDDVIDGGEYSQIKMCRQPDGDVTTFVTEMLNAD